MSDRYSTITREVPVDRPRNTAYPDAAPATGDLSSQHRVSLHPAGFRVRERGALEGTVVHAYRCPVHGLVDVRVPRSDVPDEAACPLLTRSLGRYPESDATTLALPEMLPIGAETVTECGRTATWAGSQCGQGWAAGECKS